MGRILIELNAIFPNTTVIVEFILPNFKHTMWMFLFDLVVHFACSQWREKA